MSKRSQEIIRSAREQLGIEPDVIAKRLGISREWYFDLEMFDDEIYMTLSLYAVATLCNILKIDIAHLFSIESDALTISQGGDFEQLAQAVKSYMADHQMTLATFEEMAGWTIGPFINDPKTAWNDWNVACLRDVCGVLGFNWLMVLSATAAKLSQNGKGENGKGENGKGDADR